MQLASECWGVKEMTWGVVEIVEMAAARLPRHVKLHRNIDCAVIRERFSAVIFVQEEDEAARQTAPRDRVSDRAKISPRRQIHNRFTAACVLSGGSVLSDLSWIPTTVHKGKPHVLPLFCSIRPEKEIGPSFHFSLLRPLPALIAPSVPRSTSARRRKIQGQPGKHTTSFCCLKRALGES